MPGRDSLGVIREAENMHIDDNFRFWVSFKSKKDCTDGDIQSVTGKSPIYDKITVTHFLLNPVFSAQK